MTDQPPNVVLPRTYWYAVSLVVLVTGIVLSFWQISRNTVNVRNPAQPVRGQGLVQLDQAGSHSLYIYRGASTRLDALTDRAWSTASTATISIRDTRTGSNLAVRNVYETIALQNTLVARLVEFEVPVPGTFRIQITPPLDKLKPSVRPSVLLERLSQDVISAIVGVFIGLGIGVMSIIIATTIFLIVLLRRKSFKKRLSRFPVASGETY